MLNTWLLVWHWIDEDGYIRGTVIFSSDNEEDVLKEHERRAGSTTHGWFDIMKKEEQNDENL